MRDRTTIEMAQGADPGTGGLPDIDHFVLLMQENRSFDHYFGTMSGVLGFDDYGARVKCGALPASPIFRLDTAKAGLLDDLMFADPSHSWTAQHELWNNGQVDPGRVRGGHDLEQRAVTGYFTRSELPVHYALADAFTVCDRYFCSVLGPTGSNRLYWMSGTLDSEGAGGGPVIRPVRALAPGSLSWRTFPEDLTDANVAWKVYNAYPPSKRTELTSMLKYFRNFQDPNGQLYQRGLLPRWPDDFVEDVRDGRLPSVSWVVPHWSTSEHPSYPPAAGAEGIMSVLRTLLSNPAIWERTALIVSYDENGGFFDHVSPPIPPAGTADEYLVEGHDAPTPIGLGLRVPCLVISPFTRGGWISSQTYDHTSQLRLVGRRFGFRVSNVSDWRESITSDMSELFNSNQRQGRNIRLPSTSEVDRLADSAERSQRTQHDADVSRASAPAAPGLHSVAALPRQDVAPLRRRL